ncbi:hypothetical protein ROHU_008944 [Labeo rohita]|uniref:Uncharacterized protein n=1 Tax=Labeo rohita TaxID=84645 RepID=A0A498M2C5_LABRO|nr:hypothetical protein ROHU_008944 [Labeo rohita]
MQVVSEQDEIKEDRQLNRRLQVDYSQILLSFFSRFLQYLNNSLRTLTNLPKTKRAVTESHTLTKFYFVQVWELSENGMSGVRDPLAEKKLHHIGAGYQPQTVYIHDRRKS